MRASPPARVTQRTQRKSWRSLRDRVCGHHRRRTPPLPSFRATSWETRNQVLSAGSVLPYDAAIEAIHTAPTRCRLKAGMTHWMGAVDSFAISSRFRSPMNVLASKNPRKPRRNWRLYGFHLISGEIRRPATEGPRAKPSEAKGAEEPAWRLKVNSMSENFLTCVLVVQRTRSSHRDHSAVTPQHDVELRCRHPLQMSSTGLTRGSRGGAMHVAFAGTLWGKIAVPGPGLPDWGAKSPPMPGNDNRWGRRLMPYDDVQFTRYCSLRFSAFSANSAVNLTVIPARWP